MAVEHASADVLREANEHMAIVLGVGLTSYAGMLNWLAHYVATNGSVEAKGQLDLYAHHVGLEIVAMSRIADTLRHAWRSAPAELDLRPALPLAHALGESYVLLRGIDSVDIAERLPVAPVERVRELYSASVRTWMAHHVDEPPEYYESPVEDNP